MSDFYDEMLTANAVNKAIWDTMYLEGQKRLMAELLAQWEADNE